MTKQSIFIIGAALTFTISGCATKNQDKKEQTKEPRSIVVYYSQSGTTKAVAQLLQAKTNADILEIQSAVPYDDDFQAIVDAYVQEMKQGITREIVPVQVDMANYDTLYIGFPVWCGNAAGPMENFLRNVDLKGKTIVPFCTFGSGGNTSIDQLKQLQPEASYTDWYGVRADRLAKADAELDTFLARIGVTEGEVEPLPDFSEPHDVTDEEAAIFEAACGSYQMPLGTPISVASRSLTDATEYLFVSKVTGFDGNETTQQIYVLKGNEPESVAEFTQVVR